MGGAEFSQIVQLMMEGEEKEEQKIPVPLFLVIRQLIIFGEEALQLIPPTPLLPRPEFSLIRQ